VLSIIDKTQEEPKHNTQKIVEELGWSTGKVAMADRVFSVAEPEIMDKVLANEISIQEAYQDVKKPANVHVGNNSSENEWYTPDKFIETVRTLMIFYISIFTKKRSVLAKINNPCFRGGTRTI
jgi:hypothetical protein